MSLCYINILIVNNKRNNYLIVLFVFIYKRKFYRKKKSFSAQSKKLFIILLSNQREILCPIVQPKGLLLILPSNKKDFLLPNQRGCFNYKLPHKKTFIAQLRGLFLLFYFLIRNLQLLNQRRTVFLLYCQFRKLRSLFFSQRECPLFYRPVRVIL